jgi:hypothetical protein
MNNASQCNVRGYGSAKFDALNRCKGKVGIIEEVSLVAAEFAGGCSVVQCCVL